MKSPGTEDLVCIVNLNAAYYGKPQALEYYNDMITVYSKGTNNAFRFRIYAVPDHVWWGADSDSRGDLRGRRQRV